MVSSPLQQELMAFATAIAPQEKGPPPALGAWRVLVVEDVPSQQKLLFLMLTKAGHRVSCADNGREAVALAAEQVFDVVLMDVQMPGMNGLDATRAIRAGEAQTGRHAAIVAITAHALPGDAEKCLAAGTDAYMRKPVNLVELMSLLKRLTGGEEMAN